MNQKQEALRFIEHLQTLYFEKGDMEALLTETGDKTSLIGTGVHEVCRNIEQAKMALFLDDEEFKGSFTVTDSEYDVECVSDTVCIVYGEITARSDAPQIADIYNRITAVCVQTPEGMRLAHLHMSVPDADQEKGRSFVTKDVAGERETLQKRAERIAARLQEQSSELKALTDNIPGGIHRCACDEDLTFLSMSHSFLNLVGYTRKEIEELFHNHFTEMIYPEDLPLVRAEMARQLSHGDELELKYRIRRSDGRRLWILDHARRATLSDGTQCYYCILMDITKQRQEQEELRLSLERHQIITDQTTDIIFEWDILRDTLSFSPNWRKKFGYEPVSEAISKVIPRSSNIHPEDMPAFVEIMRNSVAGMPYSEAEFRIRDAHGKYIWSRIRATVQYDMLNRPIKAVGVIIDINADKKRQQKLLEQAQRDPLTNLYNKTAIQELVEERMLSSVGKESHVLMIIDVDDFKQVNDIYGHLCGDSLLIDVASTLKRQLRSDDLVARIGGDEFLAYLPGVTGEIQAVQKAKSLLEALQKIKAAEDAPNISCSIGVAIFPRDADDYFSLFKCADMALYHTKENGKSGFSLYNQTDCTKETPLSDVESTVDIIDSGIDKGDETGAKLVRYTFQMLYDAEDVNLAVKHTLEIIGRIYNISRIYIVECFEDGTQCDYTFEWCNTGVEPSIDAMQDIPFESVKRFYKNFDADGILFCRDIKSLDSESYKKLEERGVCSMLYCAIIDDEVFKGYIGFDKCGEKHVWTKEQVSSLTLISNVLSTFLVKWHLKEKIK